MNAADVLGAVIGLRDCKKFKKAFEMCSSCEAALLKDCWH
jgi:hypothetical protein